MVGFEHGAWQFAWGNFAIFGIVCAITLILGGIDPAAAIVG
jgi:hypothetical protein